MKERIILTFVCVFSGLILAVVAIDKYEPVSTFWIVFGIFEFLALCTYNYLENGIWWLWGKDRKTKEYKEYKRRFRNEHF